MRTVYKLVCGLIDRNNEPKTLVGMPDYDSIESAKEDILNFIQGVKVYRVFIGKETTLTIYDDKKLAVEVGITLSRAEDHYYTCIQEDGSIGAMREVPFED